jgi:hypothetical protein
MSMSIEKLECKKIEETIIIEEILTPFKETVSKEHHAHIIDEILTPFKETVFKEHHAQDFIPYRDHCVKIAQTSIDFLNSTSPQSASLISIAAAFHEISIWTHGVFDPSFSWEEAETFMRNDTFDFGSFNLVKRMIFAQEKVEKMDGSEMIVEAFRRGVQSESSIKTKRYSLLQSDHTGRFL